MKNDLIAQRSGWPFYQWLSFFLSFFGSMEKNLNRPITSFMDLHWQISSSLFTKSCLVKVTSWIFYIIKDRVKWGIQMQLYICLGTGQRIQRTTIFMTLLMMIWSLCAIVVSNAYTGNMLSHLLIQRQSSTINSLEELVASSLNWIIRRGTSAETRFMVISYFPLNPFNSWQLI